MKVMIIVLALLFSGCADHRFREQPGNAQISGPTENPVECSGTIAHKANGQKAPLCPEEEIIFADFDGRLRGREIEIARAKFLLGFIAGRTTNSPSEIADKAFKTSEMIKKDFGLNYSGLRVLEESRSILAAMPDRSEKEDFLKITYLVYTAAGQR